MNWAYRAHREREREHERKRYLGEDFSSGRSVCSQKERKREREREDGKRIGLEMVCCWKWFDEMLL